jgi:hypothetical protein
MRLSGLASDPTRGAVIATINSRDNLPMTTSYRYDDPRDNLPATTTDRYDDVEAFPQALFAAIHLTK